MHRQTSQKNIDWGPSEAQLHPMFPCFVFLWVLSALVKFDISDFIDLMKFYLMIIDNRYYRIKTIFGYRLRALPPTHFFYKL